MLVYQRVFCFSFVGPVRCTCTVVASADFRWPDILVTKTISTTWALTSPTSQPLGRSWWRCFFCGEHSKLLESQGMDGMMDMKWYEMIWNDMKWYEVIWMNMAKEMYSFHNCPIFVGVTTCFVWFPTVPCSGIGLNHICCLYLEHEVALLPKESILTLL